MAEKLQALATTAITDSLTGAYNRNMLNVTLPSEMQRAHRHKVPLAIILLDTDHFKCINDTHGHQVGDRAGVDYKAYLHPAARFGFAVPLGRRRVHGARA